MTAHELDGKDVTGHGLDGKDVNGHELYDKDMIYIVLFGPFF
jgi:hypothetical protein